MSLHDYWFMSKRLRYSWKRADNKSSSYPFQILILSLNKCILLFSVLKNISDKLISTAVYSGAKIEEIVSLHSVDSRSQRKTQVWQKEKSV